VDLDVHSRHIIDTQPFSVRMPFIIVENVIAGAYGSLQILIFFEMLISIQKCMAD
jgi:hypothetical protein